MCKVGQDGTARHVRKGQGGIRWLQRKRRKNIGDSGYLSKVQFVLSLLVLGGLGYYVLGGYASEVSSIHKEADSLVRNSTEETFRRYRTSVVYAADGSVISKLNDQGASYYLKARRDTAVRDRCGGLYGGSAVLPA